MNKTSLITFLIIAFSLFAQRVWATHVRAGDMTAELVNAATRTYRFIITIYRDTNGVEGQPSEVIFYGTSAENNPIIVSPVSLGVIPGQETEIIQYITEFTFPSSGYYCVGFKQDNRNGTVVNMTSPSQTSFYIESCFLINPALGQNKSPILTYFPVDLACTNNRFVHNPGAFDAEGDSLAYRFVLPRRDNNEPVLNYRFPCGPKTQNPDFDFVCNSSFMNDDENGNAPGFFDIDVNTGEIIWDAPDVPGEYNLAFVVEEWRDGVLLSEVNRDMQIIVEDCDNLRPILQVENQICIVAGNPLETVVSAFDQDNPPDPVNLEWATDGRITNAYGLDIFPQFSLDIGQPPQGDFTWMPLCTDVRREPYRFLFRAQDDPADTPAGLTDLRVLEVRVVGPPPTGLTTEVDDVTASVTLNWDPYSCIIPTALYDEDFYPQEMIIGRRINSLEFELDTCVTGFAGRYEEIARVPIGTTTFQDTGLQRGLNYCYRIFASFPFPSSGESLVSEEACGFVPSIAPYLTKVSVEETSETTGQIALEWSKPFDIDLDAFPPPYLYRLQRAEGFSGGEFETIAEFPSDQHEDGSFTDINLDTENNPYRYQIEFSSAGNVIDTSAVATSVRLTAVPRVTSINLTWEANVPWDNRAAGSHKIFRREEGEADFVLIEELSAEELVNGFSYIDDGSFNNQPLEQEAIYCYRIETSGQYVAEELPRPLLNFSQEFCAGLADEDPPCPPILGLDSLFCESFAAQPFPTANDCPIVPTGNRLTWRNPVAPECDTTDIVAYNIYFSDTTATVPSAFRLLETLADPDPLAYLHPNLATLEGCYAVTAVDASGNESDFSNIVCNQNCPYYALPNVFTPDGVGPESNNVFRPMHCPRFVREVNFTVVNRWGEQVYASNDDIFINWDGKHTNGNDLSDGVYYYRAVVRFFTNNREEEELILKGPVHIFRAN